MIVRGLCAYLLDNREDPGLALLSTVGTNTEVDFSGVSVGLVGGSEGEDDVLWCTGHIRKYRGYKDEVML